MISKDDFPIASYSLVKKEVLNNFAEKINTYFTFYFTRRKLWEQLQQKEQVLVQ